MKVTNKILSKDGTTLIEVMISVVIFVIIMLAALNVFFGGQAIIDRQKIKRLALAVAQQRMETLISVPYSQLDSTYSESGTPVSLGNLTGSRDTIIGYIDDPLDSLGVADADGDTLDYKQIIVRVNWGSGRSVILQTLKSSFYR